MALFRAERQTNLSEGEAATSRTVGPGSYYQDYSGSAVVDHPQWSQAPFSSTAERDIAVDQGDARNLPGPGQYAASENAQANKRAWEHRSSFKSSSRRFMQNLGSGSASPGPGAYNTEEEGWMKRAQRGVEPAPVRVKLERSESAPSVPAANQAYGYEEGNHGGLVPQEPPGNILSGESNQMVGPGEYNPRKVSRGLSGPEFGRLSDRKPHDPQPASPGPGTYARKEQDMRSKRQRGKASFASTVPMAYEMMAKEGDAIPGPGAYNQDVRLEAREEGMGPKHFLSTSRRSHEVDESMRLSAPSNIQAPGPGAYRMEEPRTGISPKNLAIDQRPFNSGDARFRQPRSSLPGPGQYTGTQQDFVAAMNNRLASKRGAFGSVMGRFSDAGADGFEGDHNAPGPGSYYSDQRAVERPTSTKRFPKRALLHRSPELAAEERSKERPMPAPGSYDLDAAFARMASRGSIAAAGERKERRFRDSAQRSAAQAPAPGQYDPRRPSKNVSAVMHSRASFASKSVRLAPGSSGKKLPGPGQYSTRSDPVRPTFNVTFDGPAPY